MWKLRVITGTPHTGKAALPAREHRAVCRLAAALPMEHGERDWVRGDTELLHVQGGSGLVGFCAMRLPVPYLRRRTSSRTQGAAFYTL